MTAATPQADAAVRAHLATAVAGLGAAGVATPRLDAEILLAHVLGLSREILWARPERLLSASEAAAFRTLTARRARREPVSHLIGRREFWSLEFAVGPAALDPRPDSETLIEAALGEVADRNAPLSVLDLGAGSGCLLLTLLHEWPKAIGVGRDISPEALVLARQNAEALSLARRCRLQQGNWGDGLTERFDVIVSNPPYLTRDEIRETEPEVRRFEPHLALDGGEDGLDAYRCLGPEIARLLAPDGFAAIEIGQGQGDAVTALFVAAGLEPVRRARDLGGIERCLVFRTGRNPRRGTR